MVEYPLRATVSGEIIPDFCITVKGRPLGDADARVSCTQAEIVARFATPSKAAASDEIREKSGHTSVGRELERSPLRMLSLSSSAEACSKTWRMWAGDAPEGFPGLFQFAAKFIALRGAGRGPGRGNRLSAALSRLPCGDASYLSSRSRSRCLE